MECIRSARRNRAWAYVSCALSLALWSVAPLHAASTHPYYRRTLSKAYQESQFSSNGTETDLAHTNTHVPAFLDWDPCSSLAMTQPSHPL
jgi:hypothetical protein